MTSCPISGWGIGLTALLSGGWGHWNSSTLPSRHEASFEVPDSTQLSVTKHGSLSVCVWVCYSSLKTAKVMHRMIASDFFPPVITWERPWMWGNTIVMKHEPKGVWVVEWSVQPAYTAQRISSLFTYLAGNGSDVVSTASVLLESGLQHGWQRK